MCGIVGIYRFDTLPAEVELLRQMRESLAHRGPDGAGLWSEGGVGLAHRRLSIVDLNGGGQPLHSQDSGWVITFNGEIYNYFELKGELQSAGVQFTSQSDTEVLLATLQRWGRGALPRLNGQFSFAAYNRREKRLLLARDSMGEKPLYYLATPSAFAFASELKGLLPVLTALKLRRTLDYQALGEFLSLNYVPAPRTLLHHIRVLEAGCGIEVTPAGVERFQWCQSSSTQESHTEKRNKTQEKSDPQEFSELLESATRLRLRSDVPVGLFLSGGIDSTSVAVAASRAGGAPPTAFAAAFGEEKFNEAPVARETARRLGFPFQQIEINPGKEDIPTLIQSLVHHGDTPLADSSALAVYLLSRETGKQVKVALSGDGADELFGGYLTYSATMLAKRIPGAVRALLSPLAPYIERWIPDRNKVSLAEKANRFLRGCALAPGAAHFAWNGMWRRGEQECLLKERVAALLPAGEGFATLATRFGVSLNDPALASLLAADQRLYLPDDILTKTDRMGMAHGLEVRPVYLDPDIVAWARRAPQCTLMLGRSGKFPLREYLARNAPWFDHAAPKRGFSLPVHRWFRTLLKPFAFEVLFNPNGRAAPLFDRAYLMHLWNDHQSGKRSLGFELWGLVVLFLWCDEVRVELENL